MNRKNGRITARQRQAGADRAVSLAHILISVVALIECLLLLSFTTFSWIESSSSLIISSGEKGVRTMSISRLINYQVDLSLNSAGVATLESNYDTAQDQFGYYRDVQGFNFAQTSSADGKRFFFKARDEYYRPGDTADYNTAYNYIDFEVCNTTGSTQDFYFHDDDIFSYTGSYSPVILSAMRMSIQKNDANPVVFSVNSTTTPAISATDGTTQPITSEAFSNHVYEGTNVTPVFSSGNGVSDKVIERIKIRIWFESEDPTYVAATNTAETKAAVDAALHSATIGISFRLLYDNVAYDQIFFDDFAFSNVTGSLGSFVTDENDGYRMYLHTYNTTVNGGDTPIAYSMSRVTNNENDARRWSLNLPISRVVSPYLTNAETTQYQGTYFFYGTVDSAGTETIAYKWPINHVLSVTGTSEDDLEIDDSCDTFRNLGVVRDSTNYNSFGYTGFLQSEDDYTDSGTVDTMTLVTFRDRATSLTAQPYNAAAENLTNYQFIKSSMPAAASVDIDTTEVVTATDLYYADIPISGLNHPNNLFVIFCNKSSFSDSDAKQSTNTSSFNGKCYCYDSTQSSNNNGYVVDSSVTGLASAANGYYRVYFHNVNGWGKVYLKVGSTSGEYGSGKPYGSGLEEMEVYNGGTTTESSTASISLTQTNIYVNQDATSGSADDTISMYLYDTTDGLYKAYVPASWLTDNMYFHYNTIGYYDDVTDKLLFHSATNSVTCGSSYTYTALGYTDAYDLSTLASTGSGVGTWDDVREVKFATELIDSNISKDYVYKLGISTGSNTYADYAMIPDALGLTFSAYVPRGLTASNDAVRFTRYDAHNSSTITGYWYADAFTDADETYYAVDATAASANATTETRGYFHLAVLVDGTWENLVYDTVLDLDINDDDDPANNAELAYSINSTSFNNTLAKFEVTVTNEVAAIARTDNNCLGTRRWYVPCSAGDTVYFRWTPYPDGSAEYLTTEFDYAVDTSESIYCVVTEAAYTE